MNIATRLAVLVTFVFGAYSAFGTVAHARTGATASAQKKLTYQEEGMTVTRTAYRFVSQQGYTIYVFAGYKASKQGAYDVFTLKADPKVWFSVLKLKPSDSFAKLAAPIRRHLAALGQLNADSSHGTLTLAATSFQKHVSEEYVYTMIHNQAFRFHIVHESDWESNAPFFAMFNSIQ